MVEMGQSIEKLRDAKRTLEDALETGDVSMDVRVIYQAVLLEIKHKIKSQEAEKPMMPLAVIGQEQHSNISCVLSKE